ncbi:hypothetical protein GCM10009127_07460 [Alteraurantiacibacter aestuarii]|uniref:Phage gp6-like head-tail connector protein n=1 Tax=Alteraurantiacibacter aestuarii TaxID=650004 RepID=A0A844ZH79_9SPHN|nr:hypothetical protein [Alteraurantiacibacter aestuarii]MXO87138.1 hypothetical protein [Alteraurantiacibacter aestuarii]
MMRVILAPAILAPGALDELKSWLAITTPQDDTSLIGLLRAALDMCEAFTRQMPIDTLCEEVIPARSDWQKLATYPVQSITGVDMIDVAGNRTPLDLDSYEIELEGDGGACIRMRSRTPRGRVAVRFTAGLAPDWQSLPEALRHGIIRLAAHNYRQRDMDAARPVPPAAIAALWSPWRRLRLI